MKAKEIIDSKTITATKIQKTKQKSLRPMRSMVAVRSMKSPTAVASLQSKKEEEENRSSND